MTPVLFLEAAFRSCIRFSSFGAITLIEGNHDGLVRSEILVTILRYCIYVTLSNFSFRCITYILITRFGLSNSLQQPLIIQPLLILFEILLTIVFNYLVGLLFANPARRFISQFLQQSLIFYINCNYSVKLGQWLFFNMAA